MKKIAILLFMLVFSSGLFAQQMGSTPNLGSGMQSTERLSPKQNIFVELGGQGLLLTFNYDTRFSKRSDGIGGRAGIGYIKLGDIASTVTIPIGINYLLGRNGKYFEMGIGTTFVGNTFLNDGSGFEAVGTMSFAYRVQPEDGGFNFRIGITPIFGAQGGGYFMPYYAGLSLGYTLP